MKTGLTASLTLVCLVGMIASSGVLHAQNTEQGKEKIPEPSPTHADISYGEHERQVLDFWKAPSATPTPLVFVIHGGGWQGGNKRQTYRYVNVDTLLKQGISVVAISYRLVQHARASAIEPPVKAPLHDAARALQFVRSKAGEWNIDKSRIAAAGGSAGACTSLWLAYHDDLADPKSDDPVARESTRLSCVALWNPQTSLDPQQMKEWIPNIGYGGHAFGMKNFSEFLAERENILPWIAEYSPYALVSADDPPAYLFYSRPPAIGKKQADATHSANFGVKLQERCVELAVTCALIYRGSPDMDKAPTADFVTEYLIPRLKSPIEKAKKLK